MTSRQIIARVAAVVAVVAVAVLFLPLGPTTVVARLIALSACAHLIWRYHNLADWSSVEIGRSTMAIKGSLFVLALAANARSVASLDSLELANGLSVIAHHGPTYVAAEVGIVIGWLCMSAALIHRDRLVVRMQGEAHALPAPPPRHYLPSEEIKDERTP